MEEEPTIHQFNDDHHMDPQPQRTAQNPSQIRARVVEISINIGGPPPLETKLPSTKHKVNPKPGQQFWFQGSGPISLLKSLLCGPGFVKRFDPHFLPRF